MELNATTCYQAMLSHDARFDGKFFGAVTTTGIYCRPVCRVSPPRFENVQVCVRRCRRSRRVSPVSPLSPGIGSRYTRLARQLGTCVAECFSSYRPWRAYAVIHLWTKETL